MDLTGDALLAEMDSAGVEASMREEAADRSEMQRFTDEVWQNHLATLGKRERSALRMGSAHGKDSTRLRSEKRRVVENNLRILLSVKRDERALRLLKEFFKMKHEEEISTKEEQTPKIARKKELSALRPNKKTNKNKTQHEGTARPQESGTGKETFQQQQQLPKGMPSDGKDPSEAVGSGKSALDQAMISPATEESVTEAGGGESWTWEEARDRAEMQQLAEELWQRRLARLGEKERSDALRLGSAGGKDLLRREKHRVLEKHMRTKFLVSEHKRGRRLLDSFVKMRDEELKRRKEEDDESEKRSQMQQTAPVPPEYHEIQTALLHIQDKLANKKSSKMDKEILRLLNGISNMLDQGGDDGDSEDTNGGTNTTMVKSDNEPSDASATNSITIQAETLGQMVKYFSHSVRREPAIQEHMPIVGSDKLLIKPAEPSLTDSVTRLGLCSLQDGLDHDEMAEATSDRDDEIADEAKDFADYRRSWEFIWGQTCGSFRHMTTLSSMQYTYYTPRCNPPYSTATTPETLQIFSIKLAKITGGLGWPLSVYGVVAVRDVVDHNRNFLFYCDRDSSQELSQNDPFLRLIGPSRAVVFADTVNFEIELQVKGTTRSEDKALITEGRNCRDIFGHAVSTIRLENCFCKIESRVQLVSRTTQATILAVQVANSEKWPFKYGARVACSSLPGKLHVTEDNKVTLVTEPASGELVMVDSKDGAKLKGGDGYLHLSRNVVSVEAPGRLDVEIQAYADSGVIAARHLVSFPARLSKITREECFFGDAKVVITVAWSRVATDKRDAKSVSAYV